MSKKTSAIFSLALVTLFASSCTPTISNFGSYQPQPFPRTSFMPTSDMVEGKPARVVVFELDQGQNQIAQQADLGKSITVNTENVLTKNHLAQLVDRNIAGKLQQEIALAEMNKTGVYKGPEVADYAVSGAIANAGFTKKYSNGMMIPTRNGVTNIPPKFTYTADVSGNIKVYELPSMSVVANFEFSAKKSRSEDVKTDNNISVGGGLLQFGGQKAEGLNRDDGLVRKAGADAIDSIAVDIKNFFAKKGFILEKRVLKDKAIFKINVGSADGIEAGDKFEVIGKYQTKNALTDKAEIERRIIASGVVSDRIDPKTCWILIDDEKTINTIRLGDMVQFKYQRSFFDKASKFAENVM